MAARQSGPPSRRRAAPRRGQPLSGRRPDAAGLSRNDPVTRQQGALSVHPPDCAPPVTHGCRIARSSAGRDSRGYSRTTAPTGGWVSSQPTSRPSATLVPRRRRRGSESDVPMRRTTRERPNAARRVRSGCESSCTPRAEQHAATKRRMRMSGAEKAPRNERARLQGRPLPPGAGPRRPRTSSVEAAEDSPGMLPAAPSCPDHQVEPPALSPARSEPGRAAVVLPESCGMGRGNPAAPRAASRGDLAEPRPGDAPPRAGPTRAVVPQAAGMACGERMKDPPSWFERSHPTFPAPARLPADISPAA